MSEIIKKPAPAEYGKDAWIEIHPETKAEVIRAPVYQEPKIIRKAGNGIKSFSGVMVLLFLGGNAFILNHTSVRGNTLVFEYQMSELEKTILCKTADVFLPGLCE